MGSPCGDGPDANTFPACPGVIHGLAARALPAHRYTTGAFAGFSNWTRRVRSAAESRTAVAHRTRAESWGPLGSCLPALCPRLVGDADRQDEPKAARRATATPARVSCAGAKRSQSGRCAAQQGATRRHKILAAVRNEPMAARPDGPKCSKTFPNVPRRTLVGACTPARNEANVGSRRRDGRRLPARNEANVRHTAQRTGTRRHMERASVRRAAQLPGSLSHFQVPGTSATRSPRL